MVEVVKGELSLPGRWQAKAIKPDGTLGDPVKTEHAGDRTTVPLGATPTLWYELTPSP